MNTKEYLVQSIASQMTIYHSELFLKLDDPEIELYTQSPKYVYLFLKKELTTGKYI